MDTREFFEGMLPAMIVSRRDMFERSQGTLCLVVHGEGAWTVQFGDPDSPFALQEGINLEADLVATFSKQQFAALLDPTQEGKVDQPIIMGNPDLLRTLGHFMLPPARGGLAAQMAITGEWSTHK